MRLLISGGLLELKQQESKITVCTIENPAEYTGVLQDLWSLTQGGEGNAVLSEKEETISFAKSVDMIMNPFALDCNSPKVLKAIYQRLEKEADEESGELLQQFQTSAICMLDHFVEDGWYPLTYDLDINLGAVFKMYNLRLDFQEVCLAEKIVNYVKVMHQICGIRAFLFVGLKQLFSKEELQLIYHDILYEEVWLIDFEGCFKPPLEAEHNMILDADLCAIELN